MTPNRIWSRNRSTSEYEPLDGASIFVYDSAHKGLDCRGADVAWFYVSLWENHGYQGELLAEDLNNIGCAYACLRQPNFSKAYELFCLASTKSQAKNSTVEENKERAQRALATLVSVNPVDQPGIPLRMLKDLAAWTARVINLRH